MPALQFRFIKSLDYELHDDPHGALFSRWLPDGPNDAILLDESTQLRVWFERCGFIDESGLVFYDPNRKELNDESIQRNLLLQSGPLKGELTLELSEEEINGVAGVPEQRDNCEAVTKRAIKIIVQKVNAFLSVLRLEFGQYWIGELGRWDSRQETAANYCMSLNFHWSTDGTTWTRFAPYTRSVYLTAECAVTLNSNNTSMKLIGVAYKIGTNGNFPARPSPP